MITIIIPVKNAEKTIRECINSLLKLDYSNYRIICIIDPLNKDKSEEILKKEYKNKIVIIKNNKRGSAAHRNLVVQKYMKDSDYFAFTDADCYVARDWLKILVETIKKASKNIGCVGGINLVPKNDNKTAKLIGKIEKTLLGGGGSAQSTVFKKIKEVNSIPNCNALYKKECWIQEKQDEKLITGQDGEFNFRLKKRDWRFLINPKAKVWHHRPSTVKGQLKRMYKYGEATTKIFKKHGWNIFKVRWYALLLPAYFKILIIMIFLSFIFNFLLYFVLILILFYLFGLIVTSIQTGDIRTIYILLLSHIYYLSGMVRGVIDV
ncbi:MAG: glycosyltransferase [Promethearchaeota archaeon]